MANGEPSDVLDAVEDAAAEGGLSGLTVHQMHPVKTRRSITGELLGAMGAHELLPLRPRSPVDRLRRQLRPRELL
jgi:hypothetical protein